MRTTPSETNISANQQTLPDKATPSGEQPFSTSKPLSKAEQQRKAAHDRRNFLLNALKPKNFRTEYQNVPDYLQYAVRLRAEHGSLMSESGELMPDIDVGQFPTSQTMPLFVGPHPETAIDPSQSFSVVSFRKEGAPLGITTTEVGRPLLTSGASLCNVAWFGATDSSGTTGIHALIHITPENKDPMEFISAQTEEFKRQGFTNLEIAEVTGGTTEQSTFAFLQPKERLEKTAAMSKEIVKGLSALGYKKVTDHTGEKRPFYNTKEVNFGGKMSKLDSGK